MPPRKGTKQLKTIRKEAALQEFRERVVKHIGPLWNAQYAKAVGSVRIFRVDETTDRKGNVVKREHILVTDPDEIVKVLDEHDGGPGIVGESYYFVTEVPPDPKALDSLLDRTFGKATQPIANETNEQAIAERVYKRLVTEAGYTPADAAAQVHALYPKVGVEELGAIG